LQETDRRADEEHFQTYENLKTTLWSTVWLDNQM